MRKGNRLTCVAQIYASEQHQRLKANHTKRTCKHDGHDVAEIGLLKLNGCHDGFITSLFPKPASPIF